MIECAVQVSREVLLKSTLSSKLNEAITIIAAQQTSNGSRTFSSSSNNYELLHKTVNIFE